MEFHVGKLACSSIKFAHSSRSELTQFWALLRPPSQSDFSIDLDMTCRLRNVPLFCRIGKIWPLFPFRDFENFVHLGLASGE